MSAKIKIYIPPEPPQMIIRITISKTGHLPQYVNLEGGSLKETRKAIQNMIDQARFPIPEDKIRTSIKLREYSNGGNGNAVNVSFRGPDPATVKEMIIDYFS